MKNIEYLIDKYPKVFEDYHGNPGRVNWSCPEGWIDVVDEMIDHIQNHIDNHNKWAKTDGDKIEQLTCLQIKEKFGGLRFYTSGGDEYCYGIVSFVEAYSYEICQDCGSNQNVGQTISGWITTVCEKCKVNYKHEWKSNNNELHKDGNPSQS